ncbi:paramyosin-like [Chironomus tepperi]|uniref:paramyosin-like n=1 Tax=Chironomus tepperi TaxID=113505 RepID=UPI00391F6DF8
MFKIILLLLCMTFGTSQAVSFDCQYISGSWSGLGTAYYCSVQNSVSITSPDAAQVDSVTGTHLAGHNNDNVEGFSVYNKGQVHYFPRGLDKIFKNLIGIQIAYAGLKEIHQSDLKDLPKLRNLFLYGSSLEILEANLFKFNPNLDYIYLKSNKISHIDPNVFDKLTKLKDMNLDANTCISMSASDSQTAVQNIIKTASTRCINSDYSNLEHKVRNLEAASSNLDSEQFKENLEKLENEVKNSKFPNFFQIELQDLKAEQAKKAQEEHFSALVSKACRLSITDNLTNLMTLATNGTDSKQCAALQDKINENFTKMSQNIAKIDEKLSGTAAQINNSQCDALKDDLRKHIEDMDTKLEILDENGQNTKTAMLREIQKIKNAATTDHAGLLTSLRLRTDKIEKAMKELDRKFDDQVSKIDVQVSKFEEQDRKFDEKLSKIMKALSINE